MDTKDIMTCLAKRKYENNIILEVGHNLDSVSKIYDRIQAIVHIRIFINT